MDWAAKKKLLQAYANRHQLAPNDVRLKRLALAYHDLDPASGLRTKLERSGALATSLTPIKLIAPQLPPLPALTCEVHLLKLHRVQGAYLKPIGLTSNLKTAQPTS